MNAATPLSTKFLRRLTSGMLGCLAAAALTACAAAPSEDEGASGAAISQGDGDGTGSEQSGTAKVLHLKGVFAVGSAFDFEFTECPGENVATKGWFVSKPRSTSNGETPDDMILGKTRFGLRCPCGSFGGTDETGFSYVLTYERRADMTVSHPVLRQQSKNEAPSNDEISGLTSEMIAPTAELLAACKRPALPEAP